MSTTTISLLLGIGGMLGWGIYDFLGGIFSKQIGPFTSLFWSQLAGFATILLVALVIQPAIPLSARLILLALLGAMAYAAGYLWFFKGFEKGEVSLIAATMNLWAVFTMMFAFLFMGQRLQIGQTIGAITIIIGASLAAINWNGIRQQQLQLSAGIKEAILGAFFFGVFWNISELISEEVGWLGATLVVKGGIVLCLLSFSLLSRQALRPPQTTPKLAFMIILMGMIEVIAVALVNYGLVIGDAILITPISSALSIVTITLAVLFLKDRLSKLQIFGIGLAVTGIITTAL